MDRTRSRYGTVHAAVTVVVVMTAASAPSPFYPVLAARLGLTAFGITVVFAAYVVAQIAALLTVASVSDHIGRRPTVVAGLIVLAGGMVLLWTADSVGALVGGRMLQGAATGVLLSTIAAFLSDLAGPARARRAALLNALTPMIGLGTGAVLSSIALSTLPNAEDVVFPALAVADLVLAAAIALSPETSGRRPGLAGSLRPVLVVPPAARRTFVAALPVMLASWATGGLFLSLGATIVTDLLRVPGHLAGGLVIGAVPAAGVVAQLVLRRRSPRFLAGFGSVALAIGTVLMLVALLAASFPLYVVAVVVGGAGFGTAFTGTVGLVAPLAEPTERAGLFAALYSVSYLGFGLPAVVAGALIGVVGLEPTVLGYGALVLLSALVAIPLTARSARPRTVAAQGCGEGSAIAATAAR